MAGLNMEYVNSLVTQINNLHEYIDKKLDFGEVTIVSQAQADAINDDLKEFETWANGELAAVSEKITQYLTASYKSILEQIEAVTPLLTVPGIDPTEIVDWIKSLIAYFTKYYEEFLLIQLSIINASVTLISAMTALISHNHLNIKVASNLTIYTPSLTFPPISYSDFSKLPAPPAPVLPVIKS